MELDTKQIQESEARDADFSPRVEAQRLERQIPVNQAHFVSGRQRPRGVQGVTKHFCDALPTAGEHDGRPCRLGDDERPSVGADAPVDNGR
ncbi:hypothetical protein ACSRUE_38685 [Sorangium sp. KYC3313]|uniref:hypothetical protein n=1 Tax=Sorangium sp. KYC3313 TaxID=3449740 RepID=UPI003F88D8AA